MKQLIEDYKRRLASINKLIASTPKNEDTVDAHKRYATKESCFRTFISELEKIIKKEESKIEY